MRRAPLVVLVAIIAGMLAPCGAGGQQPAKVPRVGYLTSSSYVHPAFADLFFSRVNVAGGMWGGNLELLSRAVMFALAVGGRPGAAQTSPTSGAQSMGRSSRTSMRPIIWFHPFRAH